MYKMQMNEHALLWYVGVPLFVLILSSWVGLLTLSRGLFDIHHEPTGIVNALIALRTDLAKR